MNHKIMSLFLDFCIIPCLRSQTVKYHLVCIGGWPSMQPRLQATPLRVYPIL